MQIQHHLLVQDRHLAHQDQRLHEISEVLNRASPAGTAEGSPPPA
jgi:hypothetical protein